MNEKMRAAQAQLTKLLEADDLTAGMYVRTRGDHLIVGRQEHVGRNGALADSDRVRFTRLSANVYGLSVRRHTGRWERTPFSGRLEDMVLTVRELMQHLVARYP
jgi:hypothetical protein